MNPAGRPEASADLPPAMRVRGEISDMAEECRPVVMPGSDVHRARAVEKVEGKWQNPLILLKGQVQGRGPAIRRQQRERRIRSRREIEKPFGQLERFRALVGVEPDHEIRLNVRNIAKDGIDVLRNLPNLVQAGVLAG